MQERLSHITQEVNRADSAEQALNVIVRRVCQALSTQVCSVYLADYSEQCFILKATQGLNPQAVGNLTLGFQEGIVGLVAQREEPINLDNAPEHPNFHFSPSAKEDAFHSFLGVPILEQRQVLGVLVVQQLKPRKFSDDEVNFLMTLSAQLGRLIAQSEKRDCIHPRAVEQQSPRKLQGFPAASGLAVGEAIVFYPPADIFAVPDKTANSISAELKRIKRAFRLAQNEVLAMKRRMENSLSEEELGLFDAYLSILDHNGLLAEVIQVIEEGQWAPGALRQVTEKHVKQFEAMDDHYFQERASDVIDLARRVLQLLENEHATRPKMTRRAIIVADDITPALLAELPTEKILGLVSMRGSPSSHAAILAKALGIPAVCGFDGMPIHLFQGQTLIIDGYKGSLYLSPSEPLKVQYLHLIEEEQQLTRELEKYVNEPAITTDGFMMPLLVNTGLMADFEKSVHVGADGVGLYRTEIPFLLREQFPSEDEQVKIYRSALQAFHGKSVTFRTLDIGGDKQLPYFPIHEDNPFLGWRGIRVTLDHPDIFLIQARAIFKASANIDCIKIALPMISSVEEVDESIRLLEQAFYEVNSELSELSKPINKMPPIGIILEVPSAIYLLPHIAKRVDFISVGSNDLTQYLLAVDRNNTRVSSLFSNYHPAILAALNDIRRIANECQLEANICGEMAGDPMAAILLLGLEFNGLSMNARSLPKIKKVIRSFALSEAKDAVSHALTLEKARDIHHYLFELLEQKGLGGLIRAGK